MIDIKEYLGKYVNVECYDGRKYSNYYAIGFSPAYENDEVNEDSLDLLKRKEGGGGGVFLYQSEIKSIEVA